MSSASRAVSPREVPQWLREGAMVLDDIGRRGVVQFVGEWQDPHTMRTHKCAIFLRPPGGGTEWVIFDHTRLIKL